MIKLLGFIDFIAIIFLALAAFGVIDILWLLAVAGYLIVKGWAFFALGKDVASVIDIIVGCLLFIFVFTGVHITVLIVILVWLTQKAIFSFV